MPPTCQLAVLTSILCSQPAWGGCLDGPGARALTPAERQQVLDLLHSERFMDKSAGRVVATLLDEGRYMCSERTSKGLARLMADL